MPTRGGPSGHSVPAVVFLEQRQLHPEARFGVLAVGLRLAQVVPGQAVVVGHQPTSQDPGSWALLVK